MTLYEYFERTGLITIAECEMGIFSRTRDIFAANMTELLDRSEDPAKMIRMIILEMEETLVELRASAARSIADGKEMRRRSSVWKSFSRAGPRRPSSLFQGSRGSRQGCAHRAPEGRRHGRGPAGGDRPDRRNAEDL